MQRLAKELTELSEEKKFISPELLRDVAIKWAKYVLSIHTKEALRRGLEVSRAIAEYLNELEREEVER